MVDALPRDDPARHGTLEARVYECWSPPTTALAPWGTLEEAWDPASEPRDGRWGEEAASLSEGERALQTSGLAASRAS